MGTIERATREAIPTLADFCLVHVVSGRTILCVAGLHVSRSGQACVRALMRGRGIRRDDLVSAVAQVVRTRRHLLRRYISREPHETFRKGGMAELQHRLAPRSVLVVPIVGGGAVIGALSLCYSESGRSYTARHLSAARRLARRIAPALLPEHSGAASSARRLAHTIRDAGSSRHRLTARQ